MERRLCIDCLHYQAAAPGAVMDTCTAPALARKPDLVRGAAQKTFCSVERDGRCGSAGQHWEPAPHVPPAVQDIDFPPA